MDEKPKSDTGQRSAVGCLLAIGIAIALLCSGAWAYFKEEIAGPWSR